LIKKPLFSAKTIPTKDKSNMANGKVGSGEDEGSPEVYPESAEEYQRIG